MIQKGAAQAPHSLWGRGVALLGGLLQELLGRDYGCQEPTISR